MFFGYKKVLLCLLYQMKKKIPNNQLLTIANDHLPSYRKLQLNLEHKNNTISTDYKSGKNILLKS